MSDLVVYEQTEHASTVTLFGTDNPGEVVQRAAVVAKTLADLVRKQNLIVRIGQSDHVRVEGWTLLGSMLGVFPIVEWTRPIVRDGDDRNHGWEARVEARTRAGETVGSAESECTRDESAWGWNPTNKYGKPIPARDDYALRSMAQTRAVSKALRLPLGFVMQLAGFDPTPSDEMPPVEGRAQPAPPAPFEEPADMPEPTATEKQRRLMFAVASEKGLDEPALKALIREHTGQESSAFIPRHKFEAILKALEAA